MACPYEVDRRSTLQFPPRCGYENMCASRIVYTPAEHDAFQALKSVKDPHAKLAMAQDRAGESKDLKSGAGRAAAKGEPRSPRCYPLMITALRRNAHEFH
jgi:hypothetical protein